MMEQQTDLTTLPAELRSPQAKLVYLYLQTHGEVSIAELQDGLGMQKLSLYGVLGTLRDRGLVEGDAERFAAR